MTFLLAQISDLHVTAGAAGDAAAEGLARALEAIARRAPDAILATGDLVQDGLPEEYARLRDLLAAAPAPVFLLPGNHDDPLTLKAAFPDHPYLPPEGPLCWAVDDFPLRLVGVDQTAPGLTGGVFTPAHAEWLHETLAARPAHPTLVAFHHPPFPTQDRLFDRIGLDGADLVAAVIARHRQVRRVVCGHVHRLAIGQVAQAPAASCPSTAWSFSLALREGDPVAVKGEEPTGFLLHAFDDDAGLTTHAVWL